ncbi:MAG: signal recognition particle-docking protein FtsY, partial [Porphyromonas sp.]|nr:signal recognition particle-docking protein FtsY [Porphyromonas sp.]
MGFFDFFKKKKEEDKEQLAEGLNKSKESVFAKITRAVAGKSKV